MHESPLKLHVLFCIGPQSQTENKQVLKQFDPMMQGYHHMLARKTVRVGGSLHLYGSIQTAVNKGRRLLRRTERKC